MRFAWTAVGSDDAPFANHEIPTLAACVATSLEAATCRTEWDETYDYPHTDDPVRARQTASQMRKWCAFHEVGNGDEFSLDAALDPAPVVYNEHDWFDGGDGGNGHLLGASMLDFYTAWAQVCFQEPRGCWWQDVFRESGGVNWDSEKFRDRFRLLRGR